MITPLESGFRKITEDLTKRLASMMEVERWIKEAHEIGLAQARTIAEVAENRNATYEAHMLALMER